MSALSPSEK